MKSGRISPLLLVALVLGLGLATFVVLQFQSRQQTSVAELEPRERLEADREAAAQRSAEVVERPEVFAASDAHEDTRTQRSEVDAQQLEMQVLDAANSPVAGAYVVLFRENALLDQASTNAQGFARFAPREGKAEYALAPKGWSVLRGEVELSAGRHAFNLPQGASVAGSLSIDGAAPLEPLELTWIPGPQKRAEQPLPESVTNALQDQALAPLRARTTTDAGGAFAFLDLPPDAAGSIHWSGPFLIEGARSESDGRRLTVSTPRPDVRLRLVSGLQLCLRVVDPAGAALASASVLLKRETKTENSSNSSTMSSNGGPDGRLERLFSPELFDKLTVSVSAADGSGTNHFEFVPPRALRGIWDLGDLAVRGTRQVSVLVQDTDGRPIAGAQAMPWPAPMTRSSDRSDAAGLTQVKVGLEDVEIAVQAFEYISARIAAPAGVSELTATLVGACVLEFEVPGLEGGDHGLVVEVRGASPLFVDEQDEGPDTLKSVGEGWGSSSDEKTTTFETDPEKSGRWRISGLLPNQPLFAALRNGSIKLTEIEIAPLSQGEHRKVELPVAREGRPLRVRVLSPAGNPLALAMVYVFEPGRSTNFSGRKVDENGEIEVNSIYGDRCSVLATSEGFAPKTVTFRPIPSGTANIKLELPRSVEVELVRRDGTAFVERARVLPHLVGPSSSRAVSLGQGHYRVDGLPAGDVVIEAGGSFGQVSQLHDTSVPLLRLVVGEQGALMVRVKLTQDQHGAGWQVGVTQQGSARNLTQSELRYDEDGTAHAWISGLAFGEYDIWLERCSDDPQNSWSRVGQPKSAVLDEQHKLVEIDLQPPA